MKKFAIIDITYDNLLSPDWDKSSKYLDVEQPKVDVIITENEIKEAKELCYCGTTNCRLIRKLKKVIKK